MAPILKSKPYNLKWPLTPTQVEGLDEMLLILFKAMKKAGISLDTLTSTVAPSSVLNIGSIIGQLGLGSFGSSESGEEGPMGPPGSGSGGGGSISPAQFEPYISLRIL